MIEEMLCSKDSVLLEALRIINENAKRTVFVVDGDRHLSGILTDGDIRRLLLAGHRLDEPAGMVCNTTFIYARQGEKYQDMLAKVSKSVSIIPIVDGDMRVVDYFQCLEELHMPVANPDLTGNEFKYLIDAFLSTWISSKGTYIGMFEEKFAEFCDSRYGVAVSNGTVALHLALLALGIGRGDEVIVPDLTFAATINTVLHAGATPVIVDVDRESWCIDPAAVKKAITKRTRAIVPVHLYGQPCDMDGIMGIARKHRLKVVEDCAEAHGATFAGKKVGSFGDIGCFSFFANKIITTGEGGMCVSRSARLVDRMRLLRDHGMSRQRKYWHTTVGYNYRMTNLQAAIGFAQLERVDEVLKARDQVEVEYRQRLRGLGGIEFQRGDLSQRRKVVWLVSLLVDGRKRDLYIEQLKLKHVEARPFFYSLSRMGIYKKFATSCPNSRNISARGLSLPTTFLRSEGDVFTKVRNVLSGGALS